MGKKKIEQPVVQPDAAPSPDLATVPETVQIPEPPEPTFEAIKAMSLPSEFREMILGQMGAVFSNLLRAKSRLLWIGLILHRQHDLSKKGRGQLWTDHYRDIMSRAYLYRAWDAAEDSEKNKKALSAKIQLSPDEIKAEQTELARKEQEQKDFNAEYERIQKGHRAKAWAIESGIPGAADWVVPALPGNTSAKRPKIDPKELPADAWQPVLDRLSAYMDDKGIAVKSRTLRVEFRNVEKPVLVLPFEVVPKEPMEELRMAAK